VRRIQADFFESDLVDTVIDEFEDKNVAGDRLRTYRMIREIDPDRFPQLEASQQHCKEDGMLGSRTKPHCRAYDSNGN